MITIQYVFEFTPKCSHYSFDPQCLYCADLHRATQEFIAHIKKVETNSKSLPTVMTIKSRFYTNAQEVHVVDDE
jgi:hypothetical protein